jgi:tRNA modification GTPase
LFSANDTIFALGTGARKSAIAVFRISGPHCRNALKAMAPNTTFPARQAVLKTIRDPASGHSIDTALITRFEAPGSFTGEDLVEIGVTGGRAVIAAMTHALMTLPGLRPAEAGEFAWRAFVNGKMDLSAVEGLADLVDAETEGQRRQALQIAGGALRRECDAIRLTLLTAMATIEACLDFADEVDDLSIQEVMKAVTTASARVGIALESANKARRLRTGFTVVIAGFPNVGKSTLMNALAGREVAITSPRAGTTRDAIEVFLDLRGYPVVMIDTAGIRLTDDPIESQGVERARERAKSADLVLWLRDDDNHGTPTTEYTKSPIWVVQTKGDERTYAAPKGSRLISARTGDGISDLLSDIGDFAEENMSAAEPPILALERHRQAFQEARSALDSILSDPFCDLELIAENVRIAASCLSRVIGRIGVEDVLGEIFARLCIGK